MKHYFKILLITLVALITNACNLVSTSDILVQEKISNSVKALQKQKEQQGEALDQVPDRSGSNGLEKLNKVKSIFDNSTNALIKKLREKNSNVTYITKDTVKIGSSFKNGATRYSRSKLKGQVRMSIKNAGKRSLLETANTLIHEMIHVDIYRIAYTPSSKLDATEKKIKQRLLEISNATSIKQIFPDIDSIETDFRRTLKEIKREIQHVVIVEFYLKDQGKALKSLISKNPNTFGTINDPALKENDQTYQVLAGKSELGKPNVPSIRLGDFSGLFSFYLDNIDDIKINLK